jgi:hypothetical protein
MHPVFPRRVVGLRAQVGDGGVVGQRQEGVSQTFGEVDRLAALIVEADGLPRAECRGPHPKIHHHVEDGTLYARDVLRLAGWNIGVVDAAQRAPAGHRAVGLGESQRVTDR